LSLSDLKLSVDSSYESGLGKVAGMDKETKPEWIEEKCPKCEGTGVYSDVRSVRIGHPSKFAAPACPQCRGIGRIKKRRAD
jgi:DnaJ-class molecular chaperone